MTEKPYRRIGMVGRFKPVHLGQAAVLRALSATADRALVGIGSAGSHDPRNPFTAEQTMEMIRLVLGKRRNVTLLAIPDYFDGPKWRGHVVEAFGSLDLFVTDNPYVAKLLANDYRIERPVTLVPPEERVPINGTMVREAMARGDDWQSLVPREIRDYIEGRGLDDSFRREFGLAILSETLQQDAGDRP